MRAVGSTRRVVAKDLINVDPAGQLADTSGMLRQTFQALAEGLTGLASSDKKDLVRSVGFIFQRLRSLKFLDAFKLEWNRYREKGRIKDDYQATEQHAECLSELLDFLDKEIPDEIRFEALKKILLVSATEEHSARNDVIPQEFMKLVRNLNSGEVLVLLTTYRLAKRGNFQDRGGTGAWATEIADASSLRYPELVLNHEEKLVVKSLLTGRLHGDRSGVQRGKYNRLTQLGFDLCEFVSHYEDGEQNADDKD
jgi:hypothetical protein